MIGLQVLRELSDNQLDLTRTTKGMEPYADILH